METNCKVILKSQLKRAVLDKLMVFLKENLPNVREFEGCLSVKVLLNKEKDEMIFDEEWISKDHHTNYIAFISNNGVMAKLTEFLVGQPKIEYYNRLAL
ncbi:antibiotic biosynthesis monooxygenase [Aquimarina sediminis]|uniref:antibiotic biosynthesis monooxygenase n=1 Tax=Aquimarina sediminis TaxID=2070536 RepID=UPI000CA00931|nr:antibiotic biosynthesis monooxygenase [Aquimarina sediminis]